MLSHAYLHHGALHKDKLFGTTSSWSLLLVDADMFFESPSAFSIYLKRLVNPTRKADDGWKTVKYAGK